MKPPIIGIAGKAGHGKDTIGTILAEYGYERKAFADKVRELALAIDPIVNFGKYETYRLSHLVDKVGWDEAKEHPGARRTLQRVGEGGRQVFGLWVWIDALFDTIDKRDGRYTITDVRYANEVEAIHGWRGVVWYVNRPGYNNGVPEHVSEQLDPTLCDLVIENDGTVDDLRQKVQKLMVAYR